VITSLPLRERKKAATKERLYLEAIALFRQKSYQATTIEDIITAADVSKGTFFNYFPTKESLLHFFGERQNAAIAAVAGPILFDPELNIRTKLTGILHTLVENVEADRELSRAVVFEVMKTTAALANEPSRVQFKQTVIDLLAEGQRRGEVRAALDPVLAGGAIVGVYFQSIFEWCATEPPFSLGNRLAQTLELMWDGLNP
jgi:AcrR family transcriptional regulator